MFLEELADWPHQTASGDSIRRDDAVLAERERLGSTAIGDGIAIPHGSCRKVTKILGTLRPSRSGRSILNRSTGNPTHLFFMLVAPEVPPACI